MKNTKRRVLLILAIVLVTVIAIAGWVSSQLPYVARRGLALSQFSDCGYQSPDTRGTCYANLIPDETAYQSCIQGYAVEQKALIMKLIRFFGGAGKPLAVYSDCQLGRAHSAGDIRVCERKDSQSNTICVMRYSRDLENAKLLSQCQILQSASLRGRCFGVLTSTSRTLTQDEIRTTCSSATNVIWSSNETKKRFNEICATTSN